MGGSDWFTARSDGTLAIDVRLTLATHDGAPVYLTYQGHMLGAPEAMARFRRGEPLAPEDYRLEIVARLESGDARYRWLNDAIAVGIGEQTPTGPTYRLFTIER